MSNKYSLSRTTWLRYSWLLLVAFLFSMNVQGQLSSYYTFSQSVGTYTALPSPTVLITASSNTFGNAGFPDDQVYTQSLPCSFVFNGTSYSTVYISANAYVTFGTAPAGNNYSPLSNGTAYAAGTISAWGGDNSGMFNVGGRTSTISYETR